MDKNIEKLKIEDYEKCGNIWNMKKNAKLAEQFKKQLVTGNRVTYVYNMGGEPVAEASLVFDMADEDYTIAGRRVYFSRFLVKKEQRRKGIGSELANYVFDRCREMGYCEISVGVDIDNFDALRLYKKLGFDRIVFIGEDKDGKYMKLLKML